MDGCYKNIQCFVQLHVLAAINISFFVLTRVLCYVCSCFITVVYSIASPLHTFHCTIGSIALATFMSAAKATPKISCFPSWEWLPHTGRQAVITIIKVAGNLHFNRYFSEDRIHGETSYRSLAQRWSMAGAFWRSYRRAQQHVRHLPWKRGRIADINCRLRVCDVINSRIMGPHQGRIQRLKKGGAHIKWGWCGHAARAVCEIFFFFFLQTQRLAF